MQFPLIHLDSVDSTQDFLERHPELGYCGVMADCQLSGHGQRGKRWDSACGAGLWLSVALPTPLLKPGLVLQRAMSAVAAVLELQGAAPLGLKWPNDLVAWRSGRLVKLGGILGKIKGDRMILGVGINIWSAPVIVGYKLYPACLKELYPNLNQSLTTTSLAFDVLNAWENLTDQWRPSFYWPEVGDSISFREIEGICEGWLPDGRLAVRTTFGLKCLSINIVE